MSKLDIIEIINTRDSEMTDFQFLIYKAWLGAPDKSSEVKRILETAEKLNKLIVEHDALKEELEVLRRFTSKFLEE